MGYRLSKIYTKTGDSGRTGLGDGSRVAKDSTRVEAFGEVDELNSLIGLLVTHEIPIEIGQFLLAIQHDLFDLGGELSIPGIRLVKDGRVKDLENLLDRLNAELEPLNEFILPGGTRAAAVCHLARTVCRRAERRVVTLSSEEDVSVTATQYLNRLSDLLFVIARYMNMEAGQVDVLWDRSRFGAEED